MHATNRKLRVTSVAAKTNTTEVLTFVGLLKRNIFRRPTQYVAPTSSSSTNSGTDADDYELLVRSDGSGKGSVANLPPVYVVQRPSTPSNITSGPVPSGPTPLSPPLTVCTLAPGAEYMYIPYDGLCDYSFFDSLAITPESNGFAVTTQSADAKRFVAQAQIDKNTLYGMSVSLSTVFAPTGVVVLGHLSYGDSWKSDCVIMPPVNYVDPRIVKPGIGYGHNMLCDAWSRGAIPAPVGLAVYDANYDRRSSRCDRRWINGTWSRFRYLLRLRDFLHHGQSSSTFSLDCNRVT
ncbi:hypothetical protein MRX96_022151 [Rhipicephalus microplus]